MKTFKLAGLTATLLLTACGSQGPGDTLVEMRKKMCDKQSFSVMTEYAAPESQAVIGMIAQMSEDPKKGPDMKQKLLSECKTPVKVEKEQIDGDKATVYLAGDSKPTMMKKVDGKWKMVIDKKN